MTEEMVQSENPASSGEGVQPVPGPASPPVSPSSPVESSSPQAKKWLPVVIVLLVLLGLGGGAYLAWGRVSSALPFLKGGEDFSTGPEESTGLPGEIFSGEPLPEESLPPKAGDKYSLDTDNDSVPDFVEEAIGYNPRVDDCALKVGCGEVGSGGSVKAQEVNLLFILDSSGSMAGNVPGGQKMAVAKEALKGYVDQLPESISAGLMVYGHKGSNSEADKAASCVGIELLYPIQKVDKVAFKAAIDSFQPTGWTPIADSFRKAKEAFAGKEDSANRILLVSDGIETCGGDPCGVAKELKESKIEAMIDVIGFDVDEAAKQQLQCVAQVTGGVYYDAKTSDEFIKVFNDMGKRALELAETVGCLATNEAEYYDCLSERLAKAADYLYKIQDDLLANDPDSPEIDKITNLVLAINDRLVGLVEKTGKYTHEETEEAFEEYGDEDEIWEQLDQ